MAASTRPPLAGRDLAAERVRAGLKQADVARHLGVGPRRVSAIEWSRRVSPALEARYRRALAAACDAR